MKSNTNHHLQFFTVCTNKYSNLLKPDKYKNIVVQQLRSFVEENNIVLKAFVIMHGRIDIIWQIKCGNSTDILLSAFLRKITQCITYDLQKNHPVVLPRKERHESEMETLFWRYKSLELELSDSDDYKQKLDYIHASPLRAGLCEKPEDYVYSSAYCYQLNKDDFNGIAA
jgi:putative transposase